MNLKNMMIEEIIALKGEKAEEIIGDYFFDSKVIDPEGKKLTLAEAAFKSGREYKLPGPVYAINKLRDKKKS